MAKTHGRGWRLEDLRRRVAVAMPVSFDAIASMSVHLAKERVSCAGCIAGTVLAFLCVSPAQAVAPAPTPALQIWPVSPEVTQVCEQAKSVALRVLSVRESERVRNDLAEQWQRWRELCVGSPAVIVAAARLQLPEVIEAPRLIESGASWNHWRGLENERRQTLVTWLSRAVDQIHSDENLAPFGHFWLATALAAAGDGQAALAHAARATGVSLEARDRVAAIAAYEIGDFDHAMARVWRAARTSTRNEGLTNQYLWCLFADRSGAYEDAKALGMRVLALDPGREVLWQLRGQLPVDDWLFLLALSHEWGGGENAVAMRLWRTLLDIPSIAPGLRSRAVAHFIAVGGTPGDTPGDALLLPDSPAQD